MHNQFALLSLVYMMSFVIVFDRFHYKRKICAWLGGGNLMNGDDLAKIQAIWSACQED